MPPAKQITPEYALDVWQRVGDILAENESEPSPAKVIDLAPKYGITAYNGQFIALASANHQGYSREEKSVS